jgi:hypothetical protein
MIGEGRGRRAVGGDAISPKGAEVGWSELRMDTKPPGNSWVAKGGKGEKTS